MNTKYFIIFPEVAGGLGTKTILDNSASPPIVKSLNYQFDGWLGDDLLEAFPCFVATERLRNALMESDLTGFHFSPVLITKSSLFDELYPSKKLPTFHWLQITGQAKLDDFACTESAELIISSRARALLEQFNIAYADIREYE